MLPNGWDETHEPHPVGSKHKVRGKTYTVAGYASDTDRYVVKTGRAGDRTYGGVPATTLGYKPKNPNLNKEQFK